MEYHRNPYEKQQWILNSKDIKKIRDLLEDINDDDYYLYHDNNIYTNWKILCYQWNYENGLIPAQMTNLQIMEAVKQAYHTARKISPRKLQAVYDRRKGRDFGEECGEMSYPVKGKILYEGNAKNGMVVQFWYNFDLDLIEEAYPVRMNNVKKNDT